MRAVLTISAALLIACGSDALQTSADLPDEDAAAAESGFGGKDGGSDGAGERAGSTGNDHSVGEDGLSGDPKESEPDSAELDMARESSLDVAGEDSLDADARDGGESDIADASAEGEAGVPHHIGGSCMTDANCISPLVCDE